MTDHDPVPSIRREVDDAKPGGGALSPSRRTVDLHLRYWGLLSTPEFERWKRRHAAGWGLDLRLFTESAMLDIMLLNIARTYRRPHWRYAPVPRNSGTNRRGRTPGTASNRPSGRGQSSPPVTVFDRDDAFMGELVRRRTAGDPARPRTVRLSEYARLAEIRRALARRHNDLGAVTDSQIVDAMIAVFHGVEAGRCQLSSARRDVPPMGTARIETGDPRSTSRPEE